MDVLTQTDGPVATVTINRPEKRNSLTAETCKAVASAILSAAEASRCVVLTGAPPAFCAGGDFDELGKYAGADPSATGESLYVGFQHMIRTIRTVGVPVIAAINGHAMGAGMDLALACDIRVASSEAKLGQVWVKVGIIPGTGGAFWTTLLAGPARAAEMLLTGEPIAAERALEWGLVNEVVAGGEVVSRAREIAMQISDNPPGAVAANKAALNAVVENSYEAALEYARKIQPERFASEEFKAALASRSKK